MINTIVEQFTNKTIDQYKVLEDRYYTLRRFLVSWFSAHDTLNETEVTIILDALEPFEVLQEEEIQTEESQKEESVKEESEENND